jgi:hypothetical protein
MPASRSCASSRVTSHPSSAQSVIAIDVRVQIYVQ